MNKDMKLKRGDIVIYRKYNFLTGDKYINQCVINTSAGETIEEYETCAGLEIIKLKRPIKCKTVYEVKEVLDAKEKEYLSAVIRPFKNRIRSISKKHYFEYEYISISMFDIPNDNLIIEDNPDLPLFKKGKMYKGMKLDKEYTLKELGLE